MLAKNPASRSEDRVGLVVEIDMVPVDEHQYPRVGRGRVGSRRATGRARNFFCTSRSERSRARPADPRAAVLEIQSGKRLAKGKHLVLQFYCLSSGIRS